MSFILLKPNRPPSSSNRRIENTASITLPDIIPTAIESAHPIAEPERGCIRRQLPSHKWLYRDFPVFTAPSRLSTVLTKPGASSCDYPAQVPGRKIHLKADIVQPRSGDTAAGRVCLIGCVPQLRVAAIGRNVLGGNFSGIRVQRRQKHTRM